jgi:hypothetical protein
MKQAIDELKAIPGVVGACLFGSPDGLLQCNLPGMFKPEKLTVVGQQLAKLLAAGRMSLEDVQDLSLHYDESVVISRELRKGLIVFAICDPSFNHNLLTMSLNLLQDELREQSETPAHSAASPTPVVVANGVASVAASAASPVETLQLKPQLKEALAKVMGPMAGVILDEIYADWWHSESQAEGLPALLALIRAEISDPQKIAVFDALIGPHLPG